MNKIAKRVGAPITNENLGTERNIILQKYNFSPPLFNMNEGYIVTDFDNGVTRLGGFDYPDGLDTRFGKISFVQNGPKQLPVTDHKTYLEEFDYIIK